MDQFNFMKSIFKVEFIFFTGFVLNPPISKIKNRKHKCTKFNWYILISHYGQSKWKEDYEREWKR